MIFDPLPEEWKNVPEHMRDGIKYYVLHGIPGGGFLNAVLENDLFGAVTRTDHMNAYALKEIMRFLDTHTPRNCWGSREKVKNWTARGGLDGIIGPRGKVEDDYNIGEDEPF